MSNNTDYDKIVEYAKSMFYRNLQSLSGNILCVNAFVNSAYATGFYSLDEAKKIIRDLVLTEKRRVIARIQRIDTTFSLYMKQCKCCHLPKSVSEFAPRIDRRTNYKYYDPICKECQSSDENKAKRRTAYALSNTAKQQAHDRYVRYKRNHTKNESTIHRH